MSNETRTMSKYMLAGQMILEQFGPQQHIMTLTGAIMAGVDASEFDADEETGPERYIACIIAIIYGFVQAGGRIELGDVKNFGDIEGFDSMRQTVDGVVIETNFTQVVSVDPPEKTVEEG